MADLVSMGGGSPGAAAVLEAMLRARGLLPQTAGPRGIPGVNGAMPMRAGSVMLPPVNPVVAPRVVGGARG